MFKFTKIEKIIVPVDFSKHSEYALETAAILAKEQNAEITVMHMLELSESIFSQSSTAKNDEMMFMLALADKKFKEFLHQDYLKGLKVLPVIKHHKVFKEVDEVAKKLNADLIVMGSHGHSEHEGVFTGSNTEKVVRHSKTPVLVVKSEPTFSNFNHVVYASDFSEASISSFNEASDFLTTIGNQLSLLHVNLPNTRFKNTEEIETKVRDFLKKADGNLDRLDDVVYVADYTVEAGILNYSKKVKADLIAATTHGRTGFNHLLHGSIAEDLVNHARLPVIIFNL